MRIRAHGQVLPLICPLRSFGGEPWWPPFLKVLEQLNEPLPHRDFLLPAPGPDFQSFQNSPCTREQALPWLRQLLLIGGLSEADAKQVSLASLRVFAANLAYSVGISRDARRYLGRWADEKTANVYTRDHRTVVAGIWDALLTSHGVDTPSCDMPSASSEGQEPVTHPSPEPSSHIAQIPPSAHTCRVCVNIGAPVPMLHWLDAGDRAIGCGWKPKATSKISMLISEEDWQPRPSIMLRCSLCCKNRPLKPEWEEDLANEIASSSAPSD
eukprot:2925703-Amphidinium_carterae.2